MKKRVILKKWVAQILEWVLGSYIIVIGMTIETIGEPAYNTYLTIHTVLALISFILLYKYSKVFED